MVNIYNRRQIYIGYIGEKEKRGEKYLVEGQKFYILYPKLPK